MLKKLVIELTNLCNLDCDYCFKEAGTTHLEPGLLRRLLSEAKGWGASKITYTGGEIAVYPHLEEVLQFTEELGYRYAAITNGWHFDRLLPSFTRTRTALNHVFFSIDSASEVEHDKVRGNGSYRRIISAVDSCRQNGLPYSFVVTVNRRNHNEMESLARLASSLGCKGITFGHMLPTSTFLDRQLSLNGHERHEAEAEVLRLRALLNISVSFSASAGNDAPVCCEPLAGQTVSVSSSGLMSLCCQLADYRGSAAKNDIAGDLNSVSFGTAYANFLSLALSERVRRTKASEAENPLVSYPCDFCIDGMKKTEWRSQTDLNPAMVTA